MICSTFKILLNEIYWMANDTQLKSAIGTYNTISKLMKKASLQKRKHVVDTQAQTAQNVYYFYLITKSLSKFTL